ncbi:dioxygenase family protein [Aquimarina megaterium]|uniref:dioxygenase family protein n=1 Tax=Aquimarina megaterium TaxID=1443666 RepID=UPI00046FD4A0|nr:hypothetical protein [Aquimarina megaterium]
MKREKFIKSLAVGIVATPILASTLAKQQTISTRSNCIMTPEETIGPFPHKLPENLVKANIVGDREGVSLLINLTIQDVNTYCKPLPNVNVDIWQCDAKGNYSEYSHQLDGDFRGKHFLRGRQITDSNGKVSFISIFPGWYPGRAPHLHLEILNKKGKSLLVTQIAFPDEVSDTIYKSKDYKSKVDTNNKQDYEFRDSISENLVDTITGDNKNGYTISKIIKVKMDS